MKWSLAGKEGCVGRPGRALDLGQLPRVLEALTVPSSVVATHPPPPPASPKNQGSVFTAESQHLEQGLPRKGDLLLGRSACPAGVQLPGLSEREAGFK